MQHFGVILPNYGRGASVEAIRRTAELAEELGFASVWATEHVLVGPEAAEQYGTVYEPFATLTWIAGFTSRIERGTSSVVVPLHNPAIVAKQAATLTALTGRKLRLGIGAGWYEDEFRFLDMPFAGRGRRMDEAVRLMRALWAGETSFAGEQWSFEDVTFAPLPPELPEIWVGGVGAPSIRRIEKLGDATWHPSSNVDLDFVREVREQHPEIRLVPRTTPPLVEQFLDLGADGAIVMFEDEQSMRSFAQSYL